MNKRVQKAVRSPFVHSVFASAQQEAVEVEVYDYYQPVEYERRGEEGGLSDMNNMKFTSTQISHNLIVCDFENLTVGSDFEYRPRGKPPYATDSMSGKYISSLIEHGSDVQHSSPSNSSNGWYDPSGAWSEARPFAKATAQRLNGGKYNEYLKVVLSQEINN